MIDKINFEKDEAKQIFEKIYESNHYDLIKTLDWFTTPKGAFNNVSPYKLIKDGHTDKLLNYLNDNINQ